MKIKRENGRDEVSFSLRIGDVSYETYESIKERLDKEFKFTIYKKEKSLNLIIDIEKQNKSNKIVQLITDFSFPDVDIFIGITSSYDHGGITIPDNILNIIFAVKCELSFSYVVY